MTLPPHAAATAGAALLRPEMTPSDDARDSGNLRSRCAALGREQDDLFQRIGVLQALADSAAAECEQLEGDTAAALAAAAPTAAAAASAKAAAQLPESLQGELESVREKHAVLQQDEQAVLLAEKQRQLDAEAEKLRASRAALQKDEPLQPTAEQIAAAEAATAAAAVAAQEAEAERRYKQLEWQFGEELREAYVLFIQPPRGRGRLEQRLRDALLSLGVNLPPAQIMRLAHSAGPKGEDIIPLPIFKALAAPLLQEYLSPLMRRQQLLEAFQALDKETEGGVSIYEVTPGAKGSIYGPEDHEKLFKALRPCMGEVNYLSFVDRYAPGRRDLGRLNPRGSILIGEP
eukprot:TRINITY_DN54244_c1_g2_i4.p1 TRINITY_DN54244_c1_g2~~TRINITY_DN54244_c1_g2_i4.p1  ORF type:complete len:346 (-),score=97.07 TRINITY_DN54244_c1_g2_i4:111-1148(-)